MYRLPVVYFIILSHMVAALLNAWFCWNWKGCIEKSVGPDQYRFAIPSLRAQCLVQRSALVALPSQRLVAGSIFSTQKEHQKATRKNWASYVYIINTLEPAWCPSPSCPVHNYVTALSHSQLTLTLHSHFCPALKSIWLVVYLPLWKNMKVSWDEYFQFMGK